MPLALLVRRWACLKVHHYLGRLRRKPRRRGLAPLGGRNAAATCASGRAGACGDPSRHGQPCGHAARRFTLSGQEETRAGQAWPNFQTDGYGLWLWALADHVRRGGHLDPTLDHAARLVVRYLLGTGEVPCFDCWEEHPGNLHTLQPAARNDVIGLGRVHAPDDQESEHHNTALTSWEETVHIWCWEFCMIRGCGR